MKLNLVMFVLLAGCNWKKPVETPADPMDGAVTRPTAESTAAVVDSVPTPTAVASLPPLVPTELPAGGITYGTPTANPAPALPTDEVVALVARAEGWPSDGVTRELAREALGATVRGGCLVVLDAAETARVADLFPSSDFWTGTQKRAALLRRSVASFSECSCAVKAVEARLPEGRALRFAWLSPHSHL